MISRTLALGLVSTAFVVAAAGGSYLAVRQNTAEVEPPAAVQAAPAPAAVQETEAVVTPPTPIQAATPAVERERPAAPERKAPERPRPRPKAVAARPAAKAATPVATPVPEAVSETASPAESPAVPALPVADPPPVAVPAPPPTEPVYVEVVVPATSVIGLEIETTVSTERARVEDRVDARVTRDVFVDGRVAIPAGSRVIGAVTVVERGGKVKERARLGVRFHTLVLAGGRQVDLRTEPIYRDGESPVNDSSKKIGGAAVGGAVLGAILGGGKGAIAGATVGAAGGTAAVMAGDRKPATLTGGSVITVKLAAPVTLEVER